MAKKQPNIALTEQEFTRLANNFYVANSIGVDYGRIITDSQLVNYVLTNLKQVKEKYRVALCFICINPQYWQFMIDAISGARQMFLPGHDVDIFLWTDMPKESVKIAEAIKKTVVPELREDPQTLEDLRALSEQLSSVRNTLNVCDVGSIDWPMGTLMRFSMMLQKEEELRDYDYIFYCDIDMRFVNVVGDEVLGKGLIGAQHPMYALSRNLIPPYEPNQESTAYIPRPGRVVVEDGKPRFVPFYYAGGFQGGRTAEWIAAMRTMKKNIDTDFTRNYIAIWNDESHWNRYLFDNPPDVVLTPSYIYPDSLIEYYTKIWGTDYQPRLVTLTKKFTTSQEGGQAVQEMLKNYT